MPWRCRSPASRSSTRRLLVESSAPVGSSASSRPAGWRARGRWPRAGARRRRAARAGARRGRRGPPRRAAPRALAALLAADAARRSAAPRRCPGGEHWAAGGAAGRRSRPCRRRWAASRRRALSTAWPSTAIVPAVGRARQPMIAISVLLPEPEGPISATNSPGSRRSEASPTATTRPNLFDTWSTTTSAPPLARCATTWASASSTCQILFGVRTGRAWGLPEGDGGYGARHGERALEAARHREATPLPAAAALGAAGLRAVGARAVGLGAAELRPEDALVARQGPDGVRWHRCLRCDSWLLLAGPSEPRPRRTRPTATRSSCRCAGRRCATRSCCG